MPNVPNVPGVPQLTSYGPNNVALLAADVVSLISSLFGSGWGIFLDGVQAFEYQSVVDFDYKQDYTIASYQVEQGGFQSYDKVELPYDVKVRVSSGGTEASREALLSSVMAAKGTLSLYDVVTPEQTYFGLNITHVDFKRTSTNGVGVILIDVWFVEIRETATSTFSNTQQPGNAGAVNTGSVSPQSPNPQIQKNFDNGTWSVK